MPKPSLSAEPRGPSLARARLDSDSSHAELPPSTAAARGCSTPGVQQTLGSSHAVSYSHGHSGGANGGGPPGMRLPSRTERFERDVQRARALVSHHDDGLVSGSGSGLGVWREAVRSLLSVIDGMNDQLARHDEMAAQLKIAQSNLALAEQHGDMLQSQLAHASPSPSAQAQRIASASTSMMTRAAATTTRPDSRTTSILSAYGFGESPSTSSATGTRPSYDSSRELPLPPPPMSSIMRSNSDSGRHVRKSSHDIAHELTTLRISVMELQESRDAATARADRLATRCAALEQAKDDAALEIEELSGALFQEANALVADERKARAKAQDESERLARELSEARDRLASLERLSQRPPSSEAPVGVAPPPPAIAPPQPPSPSPIRPATSDGTSDPPSTLRASSTSTTAMTGSKSLDVYDGDPAGAPETGAARSKWFAGFARSMKRSKSEDASSLSTTSTATTTAGAGTATAAAAAAAAAASERTVAPIVPAVFVERQRDDERQRGDKRSSSSSSQTGAVGTSNNGSATSSSCSGGGGADTTTDTSSFAGTHSASPASLSSFAPSPVPSKLDVVMSNELEGRLSPAAGQYGAPLTPVSVTFPSAFSTPSSHYGSSAPPPTPSSVASVAMTSPGAAAVEAAAQQQHRALDSRSPNERRWQTKALKLASPPLSPDPNSASLGPSRSGGTTPRPSTSRQASASSTLSSRTAVGRSASGSAVGLGIAGTSGSAEESWRGDGARLRIDVTRATATASSARGGAPTSARSATTPLSPLDMRHGFSNSSAPASGIAPSFDSPTSMMSPVERAHRATLPPPLARGDSTSSQRSERSSSQSATAAALAAGVARRLSRHLPSGGPGAARASKDSAGGAQAVDELDALMRNIVSMSESLFGEDESALLGDLPLSASTSGSTLASVADGRDSRAQPQHPRQR